MFLLIPVGHASTIRRIPWVTASIVAVCVTIQLLSSFGGPSDQELRTVATQLYALRQVQAGKSIPSELGNVKLPEDADARAQLQTQLEQRLDELQNGDIARRLAYRNGTGVTVKLLTSAFAHGGWLHLIGNMLFLYLCGCNLEDRWGKRAFAGFYVAAALVSASCSALLHHAEHGLSLGASGAIAGCMGAFLVFFAGTEVTFFYLFWYFRPRWGTFEARAFWAGGLWFLLQLVSFLFEAHGAQTGVLYSAHVSGFVFGLGVGLALKQLGYDRQLTQALDAADGDWVEDDDVTAALKLLHDGRQAEALAALKTLRVKRPRNSTVNQELFELGLQLADREALEAAGSEVLLETARRGEPGAALTRFDAAERAVPDFKLNDRALAALAKSAFEAGDNALGVKLTNRLMNGFPQSPVLPSVLVEVAKAQLKASKPEQARRTLQQVLTRYPLDPYALEAKRLLDGIAPAATGT